MTFHELLSNSWFSTIVVFLTQLIFILFRTLNVVYTTKGKTWGAIWTNNIQTVAWLISTSIGVHSTLDGDYIPMFAFVCGSTVGTYLGMKNKI